ncbi:hypothetical protein [Pseudomonas gingeri]|uniref:hypothetical protein n=1 Tax=Pseudomonas gingeri TaxID=117681 RepID=UPI0015BDE1FF|nr:hypothetical protein [Pseudomonas gingeri]NWE68936.1 hypothetical protein [Pseudomonas gingeri]
MKYFINETSLEVFAFSDDGSQDDWIPRDVRPMTQFEIEKHLNPDPTPEQLAYAELAWRDEQMPIAQQTVTAIEYGEQDIPGTAQQWQKYWLDLRRWTSTNPDFPDSSKRPVAPA